MNSVEFLKSKGLTDDEIREVVGVIATEIKQGMESNKRQGQKEEEPTLREITDLVREAIHNPDKVRTLFKAKEAREVRKGVIQIVIIVSLLVLALCGHLESTQTATIFGGIVGYILGHYE